MQVNERRAPMPTPLGPRKGVSPEAANRLGIIAQVTGGIFIAFSLVAIALIERAPVLALIVWLGAVPVGSLLLVAILRKAKADRG
jgi:hypothetical protein